MVKDKSGASKRADLFKMIKSGNRKRKTCYLDPKEMLEHTSYFLQTFGKEPQGESFDNAILNDTDPTKTMFYTSDLNVTYEEVDKAASLNVNEGNLDLLNDASRVHVTMSGNIDVDLGIGSNTLPKTDGKDTSPVANSPYVLLRSDEIRISSRQNGSIKIIKEGQKDDDHWPQRLQYHHGKVPRISRG
jgi:hypothetical protein